MPDDKRTFTRGSVSFEAIKASEERLPEEKVLLVSCAPTPRGSRTRYNPNLKCGPQFQPGFLQRSERDRLVEAAKRPGEAALTTDVLLKDIGDAMRFEVYDIDLSKIPADWENIVACYDVSISFYVEGDNWEVTAKATADITLAGETYPAGDTLATFRIWAPRYYQFIRRFAWNPECCGGTATQRGPEYSNTWWPGKEDWGWQLPDDWKLQPFTPKFKLDMPHFSPSPKTPEGEGK